MNNNEFIEIYRLLSLTDNKFKQHLFLQLNEISQTTITKKVNKLTYKKSQNLKYSLVYNEYFKKVMPYLKTILDTSCTLYCSTVNFTNDEVSDLSVQIAEIVGSFADPTFISFVIRVILKQLCKCHRKPRLFNQKLCVKRYKIKSIKRLSCKI